MGGQFVLHRSFRPGTDILIYNLKLHMNGDEILQRASKSFNSGKEISFDLHSNIYFFSQCKSYILVAVKQPRGNVPIGDLASWVQDPQPLIESIFDTIESVRGLKGFAWSENGLYNL